MGDNCGVIDQAGNRSVICFLYCRKVTSYQVHAWQKGVILKRSLESREIASGQSPLLAGSNYTRDDEVDIGWAVI